MDTVGTYDQWQAAFLIAVGVPVRGVERTAARFTRFEFDNTGRAAEAAAHEWHRGEALVPAREYAAAYRDVKRLSYEAEQAA